jgi:WD40 repeat protein
LRQLEGHLEGVCCIAFAPDGKTLAAATQGCLRRWDVGTGKEFLTSGDAQGVILQVSVSPDGKAVATADDDGIVCLWDADAGRVRRRWEEKRCVCLTFSSDGKSLAWESGGAAVRVVDVVSGKDRCRVVVPPFEEGQLAFSADGSALALAQPSGTFDLWDVTTGKKLRRLGPLPTGKPAGALALAGDGSILVLCDGRVARLWDTTTGRQYPRGHVPSGPIDAAALSPDGKAFLLWASRRGSSGEPQEDSGVLVLGEVATGKERWVRRGVSEVMPSFARAPLAFSPDGRYLALLVEDALCLRDTADGREIGRFETDQPRPTDLVFAADGRTLASADAHGSVRLWDTAALQQSELRDRPGTSAVRELEALWTQLADEDAVAAYQAMGRLATPAAVPFLRERLGGEARAGREQRRRVLQLVDDLDSDQFSVRRQAFAALEDLADRAEGPLRAAVAGEPSAELRRQAERLLEKRERAAPSPDTLRVLRAVEVLERLATPAARQALQELATETPQLWLTQEATAALQRLGRRPTP